jgi:4-amino-4-deoxy-L-arabinose transferase-like glycosyltransferase
MAPERSRSPGPGWRLWAWAAVVLLVGLVRLGGVPLFDVDEGAFSEATRELLASGDWGHTTLNGAPRWDKPILTYWLQALSVQAFGLGEFALRLPSVLAAWGWALAVALFARPRWGEAAALAAGTVVATSLGVLAIGRAATADALLNLWLTLTALDLWRHLEAEHGAPAARHALRRAGLWMGLGLLTKGPVAVLVPGAAVLLFIAAEPRSAWRTRLAALLGDGRAWALVLAVALPWYAYALHRHGQAFIDGFFIRHNLARYGGTLEGHGGSVGYYLLVLPLLMLPWTPLLGLVLARARGLWRTPLGRYLLGWAGFVLVFFSLSGTKLPHYALYGLTPLALLAGQALTGPVPDGLRRVCAGLLVGLPLALVGGTLLALRAAPGLGHPLYRALLSAPVDTTGLLTAGGLATAWAGLCLWGPWAARSVAARAGAAAFGLALLVHAALAPWWGERLQAPVRHAADAARLQPAPVAAVQWGLHLPSFAVYLQQEAPRRAPRPGELALVRTDQLATLAAGGRWTPVHAERGLSLVRWQGPAGELPP